MNLSKIQKSCKNATRFYYKKNESRQSFPSKFSSTRNARFWKLERGEMKIIVQKFVKKVCFTGSPNRKSNDWKRKTRSTCFVLLSDGNRESRARLIGKYANTVKHTNYLEACLNWRTLDACRTIVHKGSEQHHARSPRTMLAGLIRQLFLRCLIVTSVSPCVPTRAASYPSLQNIFFFF